jgi:hypothetical protein
MKPGSKTRIHEIFDKMTDEHFPKGTANREGPATSAARRMLYLLGNVSPVPGYGNGILTGIKEQSVLRLT